MSIRSRMNRTVSLGRRAKPFSTWRLVAPIALVVMSTPRADAPAQEAAPIPEFSGSHIYLGVGVPERYQAVEKQIQRLDAAGTPKYYVVVVRSSGPRSDKTATRTYIDRLDDVWRSQAEARGLRFDRDHAVLIVVALDNTQVAVRTGSAFHALDLGGDKIEQHLIEPSGFYKLAQAGDYPEAIAALLDTTDRWIGSHDAATRLPVAQVQAPGPVASRGGAMGRDMALGLGLPLLAIVSAVIGLFWFVHRRSRGRLDRRIKEVRSRATDLMDRLDALKERLKLLPTTDPDFRKPMSGETEALYATLRQAVGNLWDRWLQVMETLDRAQKLAVGITSPFKGKALHDAEAMLEQKETFAEIEAGVKSCSDDMDRLNQAHEAVRAEREAAGGAIAKLDERIQALGKLGLPVDPYQQVARGLDEDRDRWVAQIESDPIGARSALEADRIKAEELLGRMERIAALLADARKVATDLEGLRRQVAEHRAKGLRLDEVGGNPDESLARADQARAGAVKALEAGDPDASTTDMEAARSMVEQARGTIEQVRDARDYCRREQPERVRSTDRLRSAMPHAEADYQRLEREFAPTSWEGAAHSLDRIRDAMASFDAMSAEAAEAASDPSQRYLAGAALLRRIAQQQQVALRLMSGIGERLNALAAVRDECRKRRAELESVSRGVEGEFRQDDRLLGTMALDLLEEARRGRDAVLAACEGPRPDWPSVREGIAKAIEALTVAQDQAKVDVRTHEQLRDEHDRARLELERVANLLAGRHEDRPAANRRFRSAAEVLDRIGFDLSEPHGDWVGLLEQVRGAREDLEHAERLAREDIRLAAQAQSEVDEAARAIEQARSSLAMGFAADTSTAEAALDRAAHLLRAQQYEQALEGAGEAQRAARRAQQEAARQASWGQMQADAEHRRWQGEPGPGGPSIGAALATGAAVAAGVFLANVVEAATRSDATEPPPSAPEPMISPEPPAPDTAVGTWQSDSGQGNW